MSSDSVNSSRDVSTILFYYKPIGEAAPCQDAFVGTGSKKASNLGTDPQPAVVHDVRPNIGDYDLDTHGFQFLNSPSTEKNFVDEDVIKTKYYAEIEKLLKEITGAKRVHIFSHTIRRNPDSDAHSDPNSRGPSERVHVDQTYEASVDRVKYHLPSEAAHLLASRVRLINVWRPIAHPVAHKPLAVADWRTLDAADLVPAEIVYPDRKGGLYTVRYNPTLEWYFLADQTPEEVVLIKIYDSEVDGRARLTPHTAFTDTTSPREAPHRQSIEVRALVFDAE